MVANGSDIQIDKGSYTRIHNAILEKLVQYDFTSREYACLLYLLRMTYGFNRKEVKLSNGDIGKAAGLDPANVSRTMRNLVANKVVTRSEAGPNTAPTWQFNKYFEQWTVASRVKTAIEPDANYCQNDNSAIAEITIPIAEIAVDVLPKQQDNYCQNDTSYISAKDSKDSKDNSTTLDAGASVAVPLVQQFDAALKEMNATNNKVPHLIRIYRMCFGAENEPTGGQLAGAAKTIGSASLLAKHMFDLVTRPPVGPVLPYIIATENGRKKRAAATGGNREIGEVQFSTNGGDIYG